MHPPAKKIKNSAEKKGDESGDFINAADVDQVPLQAEQKGADTRCRSAAEGAKARVEKEQADSIKQNPYEAELGKCRDKREPVCYLDGREEGCGAVSAGKDRQG